MEFIDTVLTISRFTVETAGTGRLGPWNLESTREVAFIYSIRMLRKTLWPAVDTVVFFARLQIWTWTVLGWIVQFIWSIYRHTFLLTIWMRSLKVPRLLRAKPTPKCPVCRLRPYYCNNDFVYPPLDLKTDGIRLVRALPLGHDQQISCEVETFNLHELPEFTALSYRWADDQTVHQIRLNGQTFYVRPNLQRYLEAISAGEQSGWHFIDAICINQHDNEERSMQVGLMRDIYKSATQVLAWISCRHEFPKLTKTSGFSDAEMRGFIQMFDLLTNEEFISCFDNQENLRKLQSQRPRMQEMVWFLLLEDDYWTRLWPVQEVLLANKLKFRCEGITVDWTDLEKVLSQKLSNIYGFSARSRLPPHRLFQNNPGTQHKLTMMNEIIWRRRKQFEEGSASQRLMPLHEAIVTFAAQKCSDPRDKIFGLLGVSKAQIKADYNMSIAEVYLHALIEGLVTCFEEHEEDSTNAVKKVTTLCWSLLHALDLDRMNATTSLLTLQIMQYFDLPQWTSNDLRWTGFDMDGGVVKALQYLNQNEMGAFFFRQFAQEKIYYDISRLFFEGRHPWLAKFKEYESHPYLAAFAAECIFLPAYWYSRLPLAIYEAHNSLMSFPGSWNDVRTHSEWQNLAHKTFYGLVKKGVVPHHLTVAAGLERMEGDIDKAAGLFAEHLVHPSEVG